MRWQGIPLEKSQKCRKNLFFVSLLADQDKARFSFRIWICPLLRKKYKLAMEKHQSQNKTDAI